MGEVSKAMDCVGSMEKQNFMPESEKTLRVILRLDEKEFEKQIANSKEIVKRSFMYELCLVHFEVGPDWTGCGPDRSGPVRSGKKSGPRHP